MSEQYTNIRLILDKIMRHPLLQNIQLETAVDYTVDFMRIVGTPTMFEEKTAVLQVENCRAALPSDFHQMIQIRASNDDKNTFRYSGDNFHMTSLTNDCIELTYKIQGGIIYTTMQEGEIEIAYEAILVDSEGYPLIPDNSSFTRALELYIKKQYFTILFDMGQISPASLQNVQTEYAWAVGDCQNEFNRLTIDKAESFYNSMRTLIIRDRQHRSGFRDNGSKELIKLQ